ncbi:MAG: SRPBCC family protein [Chloroflexia bacterium]|nr:SRPBCC family protein [Chloroflexia bacterium]
MVPQQIEREIIIAAPVAQLWAALTAAEHIGAWFGDAGAEIDLQPGGRAVFRWQGEGAFHAFIERVEPNQVFAYRWAHKADEQPADGNSTLVEFTLTPDGESTRLRVVESGFTTLHMTEAEQAKNATMNTQGWHQELDELREYAQSLAA